MRFALIIAGGAGRALADEPTADQPEPFDSLLTKTC